MADKFFQDKLVEMMQNGYTSEQIAQMMTNELNEVEQKIKQEAKEREMKEQARLAAEKSKSRESFYKDIQNTFNKRYEDGKLEIKDVANLAALAVTPDYPDWTAEDIAEFVQAMIETIPIRAAMVGKKPFDALFSALDVAGDLMQRSEPNEKKCGEKCKARRLRSVEDMLREFLEVF